MSDKLAAAMAAYLGGPTVTEATWAKINENNLKIEELQNENKLLHNRLFRYVGSTMSEAERIATES
jgi:hypothetical protein